MPSTDYSVGLMGRFFLAKEATKNVFATPVAADGARILSSNMTVEQERELRRDRSGTRGYGSRITRRRTLTWDIESYLIPSGVAGTEPDLDALFEAAFGTKTIVASTSVTYAFDYSRRQPSLQLTRHVDPYMEVLNGAWVNQVQFSFSGGEEPKITASGEAMSGIRTGQAIVSGAHAAGSTFDVSTDEGRHYATNSVIKFQNATTGALIDDNSGAGYLVLGVTVDTVAVSPNHPGLSGGEEVVPFTVAPTTAGEPLPAVVGSITFDDGKGPVAAPVMSANFTIETGGKAFNDEFGFDAPTDYLHLKRRCTGQVEIRVAPPTHRMLLDSQTFRSRDMTLTVGSTAGDRVKLNAGNLELEMMNVDIPEEEEATVTAAFELLEDSAGGNDNLNLVFD